MYRIVHNEHTGLYRVEKRGWFSWNFVTDPDSGEYLGFDGFEEARDWICEQSGKPGAADRRWKVVQDCTA